MRRSAAERRVVRLAIFCRSRPSLASGQKQKKTKKKRPATGRPLDLGIKLYATCRKVRARSVHTPRGWGAEESGMRSEPGPEATVFCFARQLGTRLTELGPHYDSINESVTLRSKMPQPSRETGACHTLFISPRDWPRIGQQALARAPIWRNHEASMTTGGAAWL
jgi:hypothetical protein